MKRIRLPKRFSFCKCYTTQPEPEAQLIISTLQKHKAEKSLVQKSPPPPFAEIPKPANRRRKLIDDIVATVFDGLPAPIAQEYGIKPVSFENFLPRVFRLEKSLKPLDNHENLLLPPPLPKPDLPLRVSFEYNAKLQEFCKKWEMEDSKLVGNLLVHASDQFSRDTSLSREYENYAMKMGILGENLLNMIVANYMFQSLDGEGQDNFIKIQEILFDKRPNGLLYNLVSELDIPSLVLIKERYFWYEQQKFSIQGFFGIIAAMYMEKGYESTAKFVYEHIIPKILQVMNDTDIEYEIDYIAELEKLSKLELYTKPLYTKEVHKDDVFTVGVYIDEELYGLAHATSLEEAQVQAAREAYNNLYRRTKKNDINLV